MVLIKQFICTSIGSRIYKNPLNQASVSNEDSYLIIDYGTKNGDVRHQVMKYALADGMEGYFNDALMKND